MSTLPARDQAPSEEAGGDLALDLQAARTLLKGTADVTPIQESRWLSDIVDTRVGLKCENLQRTGSFKIRGAYVRIARLPEEERAHGVVAASAGNHAQGVALSAAMLGVSATVFMPDGAPIPKQRATRGYRRRLPSWHPSEGAG